MVLDSFYNEKLNFRNLTLCIYGKKLTLGLTFILLEGLNRIHGANLTLVHIVYKEVQVYSIV